MSKKITLTENQLKDIIKQTIKEQRRSDVEEAGDFFKVDMSVKIPFELKVVDGEYQTINVKRHAKKLKRNLKEAALDTFPLEKEGGPDVQVDINVGYDPEVELEPGQRLANEL